MDFFKVYKDGDTLLVALPNNPGTQKVLIGLLKQTLGVSVQIEDLGFADEALPETPPALPLTAKEFARLREIKKENGQLSEVEKSAYDNYVLMLQEQHTPEEKQTILADFFGDKLLELAQKTGHDPQKFLADKYDGLWKSLLKSI